MNAGPPFPLHDLYPHCAQEGISTPAFASPERIAEISERFKSRKGDIIVSTYPKSGTTWTQTMLYNLLGCPNGPIEKIDHQVPWLQATMVSVDDILGLKSPRIFKTHDRWEWMIDETINANVKIIYIYRNPKDVYVSYFHHVQYLKMFYGEKLPALSIAEFYDALIRGNKMEFGPWADHVVGWLEQRHRDNILFLTYEDMSENTERELRKIIDFLGLDVDEERIQVALEEGKFENMQKNDKCNYSWYGCKDTLYKGGFVRRGKVGGWKDELGEEQSEELDREIERVVAAGGRVRCEL